MPTYQYRCAKCGEQFELWQSIHDDALQKHPGCGGSVTKVMAPAGIVLKGSGFYRTDSRAANGSKNGAGKGENAKSGKDAAAAKSDSSAKSSESGSSDSSSSSAKSTSGSTSGSTSTPKAAAT